MSKIPRVAQYEQITYSTFNNVSKYMLENVLKDYSRYCIANVKNVVHSNSTLILQNTGADYNIQISPFFAIDIAGNTIIRTSSLLQSITAPTTNPRVDIIQAELGYTNQNSQSSQFINPTTGVVSSSSTFTEFGLEATISVKQGAEAASPTAPATDSGKIKIGEVYVATTGGIANTDIFNVTSEYGENNTGWTNEQSITTLLVQIQNHRQDTILDHPNQSVTSEKLNNATISDLRSMSLPVLTLYTANSIVLHEITVPVGKKLVVFNMGIARVNGLGAVANLIMEVGSYSGGFSQLLNTNQRNVDYTSSNEFAAGVVVQFRVNNTSGSNYDITSHFVYTLRSI